MLSALINELNQLDTGVNAWPLSSTCQAVYTVLCMEVKEDDICTALHTYTRPGRSWRRRLYPFCHACLLARPLNDEHHSSRSPIQHYRKLGFVQFAHVRVRIISTVAQNN